MIADGSGGWQDVFGNPLNYPIDESWAWDPDSQCVILDLWQPDTYFAGDCFDNALSVLCRKVYP